MSLTICLLGLSAPAGAERWAKGGLAVGVLSDGTAETAYAFGDFAFGATWGRWEAEAGMFGVVGRLHETYATLNYRVDHVTYRLGFPRPAYDLVAPSVLTQVMPRLALDDIGKTRSHATYGTMFVSDFLPFGAVADAELARGRVVGSIHAVPGQDVLIVGAGFAHRQGNMIYAVAAEAVAENDTWSWNAKATAEAQLGRARLGVGVFDGAANGQTAVVEAVAGYTSRSETEFTALVQAEAAGPTTLTLGIAQPVTDRIILQLAARRARDDHLQYRAAIAFEF